MLEQICGAIIMICFTALAVAVCGGMIVAIVESFFSNQSG